MGFHGPAEDPVARTIGLESFKERALRTYERALERIAVEQRAKRPREPLFPPPRGALIHQGVRLRSEEGQAPVHPDRPHSE
jgi:hypothetical protein